MARPDLARLVPTEAPNGPRPAVVLPEDPPVRPAPTRGATSGVFERQEPQEAAVLGYDAVVRTRFLVVDHDLEQGLAWQSQLRPFASELASTLTDARAAIHSGGIIGIVMDEAPSGESSLSLVNELRDCGDRTPILVLERTGDALLSNRCHLRGAGCVGKLGAAPNVRAFAHEVTRDVTDDDLRDACTTFARQYGLSAAQELILRTMTHVSGYSAIGEELGISPRTVEKQVERIRARTAHSTREELLIALLGVARRRQ